MLMVVPGTSRVRTAYACSAGDDFDPIASSEVIVAGRVTSWAELPGIPSPLNVPGKGSGDYRTIGVVIEVDLTLKGEPLKKVTAIDSYMFAGSRWVGTSCAIFDADPTGRYVVLGLWRGEDGYRHLDGLRTFFIGEQPAGEGYERALERLDGLPQIAPPVTGTGGLLR
jgi:hypothetical protein